MPRPRGGFAPGPHPRRDVAALGDAAPEEGFLRIGVAVQPLERAPGGLDHLGGWAPRGLVRGELDQVAVVLVGLRGRVDRDRLQPAIELDRRHWAPWRSR